ncbi:hypothetical protein F-LCD7_0118 [Faustovirus]|nr:hypothetical protein F-LCD7_0118 [Faustovirus]
MKFYQQRYDAAISHLSANMLPLAGTTADDILDESIRISANITICQQKLEYMENYITQLYQFIHRISRELEPSLPWATDQ